MLIIKQGFFLCVCASEMSNELSSNILLKISALLKKQK